MLCKKVGVSIYEHFHTLPDPRRRQDNVKHPLMNLVTIALCAVISGADDFVAIELWAKSRKKWLAKFLDLSAGIPSHDRFNAVLAAIKPAEFERCLLSWIQALHERTGGKLVAIDGKTLRRSFDRASGKSAIHMVSAWAAAHHLTLGQVVVDAKSNEITAIPQLLEMLELQGALVTIDAMGCQTEIAHKIVQGGGTYLLHVKANQPTLYAGLRQYFDDQLETDFAGVAVSRHATHEKSHGREETRHYFVCSVPATLPDAARWPKLKAIGVTISETIRDGKVHTSVRYYILSRKLSARRFATAVRGHWSIENNLHWQLDVTFREDHSRLRKGHSNANFSVLRRTALTLLKNHESQKVSIKNRRMLAASDDDYRAQVVFGL